MSPLRISLVALALASAAAVARADVPPPPGITRVQYLFHVDVVPEGHAVIAFPTYDPGTGGRFVTLEAGKDVQSFQGYRPGLYLLPAADAAALAGKDEPALKAALDASARQCLKQVPRVYELPDEARITKITDTIHLDRTAAGCEARLVRTQYEGPAGERGEGGVDASGKRTPPAPFGKVPDITESGFVLAASGPAPAPTPTPTPTSKPVTAPPAPVEHSAPDKAGGCSVRATGERASLVLLALLLLARRRRE